MSGYTLDSETFAPITHGFAVNRKGQCARLDLLARTKQIRDETIRTARIARAVSADVGVWADEENGVFVIDTVDVYSDREHALNVGRDRGQRFICDVSTGEAIPCQP